MNFSEGTFLTLPVFRSAVSTDNEDIEGIVSQTADANDERGTLSLALLSDVIVLCLIEDIRGADAVLTALHFMKDDVGGPCHLLVLSTTMTWAKTKIPPPKACFLEDTFAPSSLLRPASMVPTSNSNQRPATNNMGPGGPSALPRTASPVVNSGTASPSREASRQQRIAGQGGGSSPSRSTSPHRAVATSTTSFRRRQPDHLSEPCFIEEDYILRKPPSGGYLPVRTYTKVDINNGPLLHAPSCHPHQALSP